MEQTEPNYRRSFAILLIAIMCGLINTARFASAMQQPAMEAEIEKGDQTPAHRAARLLAQSRPAGDVQHANLLVQTAREIGRDGDLETALRLLLAALDHYSADKSAVHLPAIFTVRSAIVSAAWQLKNHELVVAQGEALLMMPGSIEQFNTRVGVMQMRAKSLTLLGRYNDSLTATRQLAGATTASQSPAAEHSLAIGAAALRAGQPQVAEEAYRLYLDLMPEGARRADAELGIAWAAVSGAQSPEQAENLLSQFVSDHSNHGDVPHAIAARANVLDRMGKRDEATRVRLNVLTDYSDSVAASQVLDTLAVVLPAPWPELVRSRWKQRLDSITNQSHKLSAETFVHLFASSLESSDDPLWQSTVTAMLKTDGDGNSTTDVLVQLSASHDGNPATKSATQVHVAEHLAVDLLGRLIDLANAKDGRLDRPNQPTDRAGRPIPAACESACRWAGTSGRWTMLAMLAEDLRVPNPDDALTMRRGPAIDRMVAESLMQTHRGGEALPWWLAIIDAWQCEDFPTLIRAAETSVAFGTADDASERLEAAKLAAGDDGFNVSLTRMLEAELAIRRARLDEARDLLAVIVRATETTAELRPRAQWLIGETYFMQQKYAEAIDAYRRVDTLDATGQWAAVALLQAGKSFEKLARPREAATCYTALLTRFADLPHANHARTRLAQIGGDATLRR